MRKAAHLMVSSLAGSLALVTCKDPLKVALTNTLRALMNQVRSQMTHPELLKMGQGPK
jgi:CCR4-NOT transcription complex subunit 1